MEADEAVDPAELETLRESRQRSWTAFRRRARLSVLPYLFADVVDAVAAFIDNVHDGRAAVWVPAHGRWE